MNGWQVGKSIVAIYMVRRYVLPVIADGGGQVELLAWLGIVRHRAAVIPACGGEETAVNQKRVLGCICEQGGGGHDMWTDDGYQSKTTHMHV